MSKSLIDLCFSNMNNIFCSGVVNSQLSDHNPIFLVKKKAKMEKKPDILGVGVKL